MLERHHNLWGKDKAKPVFEKQFSCIKNKSQRIVSQQGQKQAEDMIVQCQ
jgi:hypothetical protein